MLQDTVLKDPSVACVALVRLFNDDYGPKLVLTPDQRATLFDMTPDLLFVIAYRNPTQIRGIFEALVDHPKITDLQRKNLFDKTPDIIKTMNDYGSGFVSMDFHKYIEGRRETTREQKQAIMDKLMPRTAKLK